MNQGESAPEIGDYEERKRNYDAYLAYTEGARIQQVASQQSYDKAILLYSSGGLALSITFLKDLVGGAKNAVGLELLHMSWVLFALAMSATVLSFLVSAALQAESIENAEEFYLHGKEDARNKKSCLDPVLFWLNRASGLSFVCGVATTVWFAGANI